MCFCQWWCCWTHSASVTEGSQVLLWLLPGGPGPAWCVVSAGRQDGRLQISLSGQIIGYIYNDKLQLLLLSSMWKYF